MRLFYFQLEEKILNREMLLFILEVWKAKDVQNNFGNKEVKVKMLIRSQAKNSE